jgi:tryptophanyl-tRNA synthetase
MPLLHRANPIFRLTGIRPTGRMHIGHYFSVIKPAVEVAATVLIAEYHAPQGNPGDVREMLDTLRRFGADDIRMQSEEFDAELYFQLLSIARVGELERMTQYMTAGDDNDAHLLVYPVLMVHDVMGYDEILVGEDQMQHINYARDLIERYNRLFNKDVRLPVAKPTGGRVMSLTDPEKKMSKSEPGGCIFLDDSPAEIERKIKAATMDDAGRANLVELYRNLGGTEEIPRMNSEFKPMVAAAVIREIVLDPEEE